MALENLSLGFEDSSREELCIMPSVKDFQELSEKEAKYSLNKDKTLTLKNKLVMREGTHNGVYYSWDELKANYMTGEGAGLFYDHDDSVKNYAGLVKNLKLNESEKSIYGDVHVTNLQAALNISLGAKWGISPTIDAEKLLRDGEKHALDPNFLSYSLVLRPAVRETMLNSADTNIVERRFNKVENTDENLLAEKNARIQQLEEEAVEANKKVEEAEKKVEDAEKKEVEKESEELCALERSIGFTSEAENDSRLEELKSLSAESRSNLRGAHEKYSKILKLGEEDDDDDNGESAAEELKENFLVFRKKYLAKNPKATKAEIKAAYAKLAAVPKNDKYPYPKKKEEDLNEANAQARMKNELADETSRVGKVNSNILAYMKEQEQ